MNFQRTNNIAGWIVFAVAFIAYWLTMEETASYWDCGEFIAVSYKLEVPHPPGAPLYLLIGRLFSFLAFGDVTKVAYWVNFSSVIASAFCSLFLFWSITLFGRKLLKVSDLKELNEGQTWLLVAAGLVGSLAYTFSESAWFSAAEAEVYAMSSFFTAFVVWAMLKWEVIEDDSKANRWLLLLFYMMGLSIGVHLLNLVTIPALALIFYFKKYKTTPTGIIVTLLVSLVIIYVINDLIIPGLPTFAGGFELYFVNSLGLPFGSGAITFGLIILGSLVYGIYYTQKIKNVWLNTSLNALAFILIGYASYTIVVIRSNHQPPINENAPSDVMSFVSYLKREQYGSRPLLYGPYFFAQPVDMTEGENIYYKGKDKYEVKDKRFEYVYSPKDETLLPRIYSSDPAHQSIYRQQLGLREGEKPNWFSDNLYFMFNYQIGHMYLRYLMFNFGGRESDEQGAGWLGPAQWFKDLPQQLEENKARNNFFLIPFALGIIGLLFQASANTKSFLVIGLLFILTGVALVVYLNSPPSEPRERDYIYVGSYYAFSIWIGFAVIAIADTLNKFTKNLKTSAIIAGLIGLTAPAVMAQQGWDDHNRSDRYFSVDSAINYLESCAPNSVLFSGGDNDTFPLWYAQEVENVRTDVRVVVLSYYNTDWYIEQSKEKHYESEPFKYTLNADHYRNGGLNDYLPYYNANLKQIDLKKFIDLVRSNNSALHHPDYGHSRNMVPSREFVLPIDVEKVKSMGIIPQSLETLIVPEMRLRLKGSGLEKKDLALLDLLATWDWERPLYVNNTSLGQFNVDLTRYIVQEGNAYRILPVLNPNAESQMELVNTKVSYENMLKKFQFRNMDRSDVYFSPEYRNFVLNHRTAFNSLAQFLVEEGDSTKAKEVLLFSLNKMPDQGVAFDYAIASQTVPLLFEVGEKAKAVEIANLMWPRASELADYYVDNRDFGRELQINVIILGQLQRALYENGETELAKKIETAYDKHSEVLKGIFGRE
jgi:hypothetical protein